MSTSGCAASHYSSASALFLHVRVGSSAIRAVGRTSVLVIFGLGQTRNCAHVLARIELHQPHALRVASGDSHGAYVEPDHLAAVGYQDHLVVGADLAHADHFAGLVGDVHRDDAL